MFYFSTSTSPGEAVARNATTVSLFKTNSCVLHRLEPHLSHKGKPAHAHAGTSLNSRSIDPFRSLLTPQAWALHHKSNTTSLVPVPALMNHWPALNSAVVEIFAGVPCARFNAGERSVHAPALNRGQFCMYLLPLVHIESLIKLKEKAVVKPITICSTFAP